MMASSFSTYAPNDMNLIDKLEKNNIEIIAQPLEKILQDSSMGY